MVGFKPMRRATITKGMSVVGRGEVQRVPVSNSIGGLEGEKKPAKAWGGAWGGGCVLEASGKGVFPGEGSDPGWHRLRAVDEGDEGEV